MTVDELFALRSDLAAEIKKRFGSHTVEVSSATYSEIKSRCDSIERDNELYRLLPLEQRCLNLVYIRVNNEVPDGEIRGEVARHG